MNVVFSPALASFLTPAVTGGALCLEGPCLLGWAWSILALTFASAWIVRCWQSGDGDVAARLMPAAAPSLAASPRIVGSVSQAFTAPARPARTELAASALALRASPTTDMAARPVRNRITGRSLPPLSPSRSTGTPTEPDTCSGPPGQLPPA